MTIARPVGSPAGIYAGDIAIHEQRRQDRLARDLVGRPKLAQERAKAAETAYGATVKVFERLKGEASARQKLFDGIAAKLAAARKERDKIVGGAYLDGGEVEVLPFVLRVAQLEAAMAVGAERQRWDLHELARACSAMNDARRELDGARAALEGAAIWAEEGKLILDSRRGDPAERLSYS